MGTTSPFNLGNDPSLRTNDPVNVYYYKSTKLTSQILSSNLSGNRVIRLTDVSLILVSGALSFPTSFPPFSLRVPYPLIINISWSVNGPKYYSRTNIQKE